MNSEQLSRMSLMENRQGKYSLETVSGFALSLCEIFIESSVECHPLKKPVYVEVSFLVLMG